MGKRVGKQRENTKRTARRGAVKNGFRRGINHVSIAD
jgi:hypothetical protein